MSTDFSFQRLSRSVVKERLVSGRNANSTFVCVTLRGPRIGGPCWRKIVVEDIYSLAPVRSRPAYFLRLFCLFCFSPWANAKVRDGEPASVMARGTYVRDLVIPFCSLWLGTYEERRRWWAVPFTISKCLKGWWADAHASPADKFYAESNQTKLASDGCSIYLNLIQINRWSHIFRL